MGLLDRLLRSKSKNDGRLGSSGPGSVQATLFSGNESLEVKGESFYQQDLQRVVAELGREIPAILQPDADNPYDSNAVSVWTGGLKVGYLSREDGRLPTADSPPHEGGWHARRAVRSHLRW